MAVIHPRIFVLLLLVPFSATFYKSNSRSHFRSVFARQSDVTDGCLQHDYSPEKCRAAGCEFSCSDLTCDKEKEILDPRCDTGCEHFCFDECGCAGAGCEYNFVDNSCKQRVKHCHLGDFDETSCFREDAYYINNGLACLVQNKFTGRCSVLPRFAVNFNGPQFTDHEGITYYSDKDPKYTTRISSGHTSNTADVELLEGSDEHELYKGYAEISSKNDSCIGIGVNVKEVGYYEAGFKTAEFKYTGKGDRLFGIHLGRFLAVPTFDILAYVNPKQALHVIIKFRITEDPENPNGKLLYIKGRKPSKIFIASRLLFQLCGTFGRCPGKITNSPTVSAMYVNKIG